MVRLVEMAGVHVDFLTFGVSPAGTEYAAMSIAEAGRWLHGRFGAAGENMVGLLPVVRCFCFFDAAFHRVVYVIALVDADVVIFISEPTWSF